MESLDLTGIQEAATRIIAELAGGLCNINPGFIKGMYITGSIPLNDFHSNKSDVDLVILCEDFPGKEMVVLLKQVHETIQKRFKKPSLQGCYLTPGSLFAENPQDSNVLSFNESSIGHDSFGMAPITLSELKTTAHTVFGIPARDLKININTKGLNDFLYKNINSYWHYWIGRHSLWRKRLLLLVLVPQLTEWAILGVARQLCTLQTGKIVSKTEAGYYCLQQVPAKFHNIIHEAIRIRKDNRKRNFLVVKGSYYISPSIKRSYQAIACVNFIIALFNKTYNEKQNNNHLSG